VPVWRAGLTVWREPRATFLNAVRGDAAGLVIGVAWLTGVLEVLQTSAMRASMEPNWGPFALLMAVSMGPLLGFVYFDAAGSLLGTVGRRLGGTADTSDARVALACGSIVELVALPLWSVAIGVYGPVIFTKGRPPAPTALVGFAALQVGLWLWAWCLRIVCLAEAHEFSVGRALMTVALAWLTFVVVLVGTLVAIGSLVGK
jgi:hypothetical protein